VRVTDITALCDVMAAPRGSGNKPGTFLPPPPDWPGRRQDFAKQFKGHFVRYTPPWGAAGARYEGVLTGALVCKHDPKNGDELWATLRVEKV